VRLGASLILDNVDPEAIARAHVAAGFAAAICPPVTLDQPERIKDIQKAFAQHDVMLAEIGVWNNMLHPVEVQRAANLKANVEALALTEEVGVRCCVNIAGSFDPDCWDGPHPKNLSIEAFELTVENIRQIIDAVNPKRAFYSIEPMPWMIPDSIDIYLRLLEAVDRPMFAVHLDPVNMINCPARLYDNARFLRDCFKKLGPWIVSCHAKDIKMSRKLTVHLDEVRPGQGVLDYDVFLSELNRLPGDVPLILEHLPLEEYPLAREYIVGVAERIGVSILSPSAWNH
jgi:sugar phosphate isomerase/epimerase